mgnify:FL=1
MFFRSRMGLVDKALIFSAHTSPSQRLDLDDVRGRHGHRCDLALAAFPDEEGEQAGGIPEVDLTFTLSLSRP